EYVPYTDVQDAEEFDFDTGNRREAADAMYEAESRLYEGEVLTGRFYHDTERPTYADEKRELGEVPADPLAERYFEDGEWERAVDEIRAHHK
ncbi:MAG: 2-ketoglutarate ferredoxin oxidoreductase subunit beta, partial [Haloarcula sp.]